MGRRATARPGSHLGQGSGRQAGRSQAMTGGEERFQRSSPRRSCSGGGRPTVGRPVPPSGQFGDDDGESASLPRRSRAIPARSLTSWFTTRRVPHRWTAPSGSTPLPASSGAACTTLPGGLEPTSTPAHAPPAPSGPGQRKATSPNQGALHGAYSLRLEARRARRRSVRNCPYSILISVSLTW